MPGVEIEIADPDSVEARVCIEAYFAELRARFDDGFDPTRSVSADGHELVPPAGAFLIARIEGRAVGCGALKIGAGDTGEIKRMWVDTTVRGQGVAKRLLSALESQAAAMGARRLRLDTNRALTEARAMYLRSGYAEIAAYNDNPYAHHWFEKMLARQD